MKKIILSTLATLVATGSIFTSYGSASAHDYRKHRQGDRGAAIVGGLAAGLIGGLVAGALIEDRDRPRYDDGADYRYSGRPRYEGNVGYRGDPGYRYSGGPRYEDNSGYRDFEGSGYRYYSGWR
ncbi:hypothetical protein [Rhizobium ruizarguesonis]|uniref:hypothetical protein n=1 Tax=Rhizobium ruizarguesonis TaxID=2081791 RepID=UPI0013CF8905|nr:hypothetical protein [Rhizobium ruizarguesonis]MBY5834541.1 hypothetical protein [Rhizobium leguminosarum]MBY5855116.1 hypothetical protein [Rhizobium leguminosarum]MBY5862788.1 hypothetical protein [Rhizobium leguminosarum]MBY5897181.1 hypothetical protein [Rhizobium leguminosarum]NEH81457.1 hypothetical protein [Rhizobium ruizarguesonis]